MSALQQFQFLNPLWLLCLPVVWLALAKCAHLLQRDSAWQRICDQHLWQGMTRETLKNSGGNPLLWLTGALISIGIIAAASPSWSRVTHPALEATTARVIVLDLSRAMLVQDLRPNRLTHAAAAALELVQGDYDGETGLIVFSASAFVVAPLSRDATTLEAFIEAMHPDTMPVDGYDLAGAIATAQSLLQASFEGHGDILVLSAGDGSDERALDAAAIAAGQGNRVSILAVGSEAGGPVLDDEGGLLRGIDGQIRLSRSNFALLERVAQVGNGRLAIAVSDLANDDPLVSRLGAMNLVESTLASERDEDEAADDGVWLIWLMLPLAWLLFRKNLVYVVLPLLWLPLVEEAQAQSTDDFWRHSEQVAHEAYLSEDYATAARLTESDMLKGASLYRQGQYEAALDAFNDENSALSLYNRANSLTMLQRYVEAIQAYEKAIELDSEFEAARHNLRLVRLLLREQQASAGNQVDPDSPGAAPTTESADAEQPRIGYADELQGNPADEQNQGPGSGAEQLAGQVDPLARFDGEDPAEQRFVLRARTEEQMPENAFIEGWINDLPETSTELYRRKFLRDYRQIRRQPK